MTHMPRCLCPGQAGSELCVALGKCGRGKVLASIATQDSFFEERKIGAFSEKGSGTVPVRKWMQ